MLSGAPAAAGFSPSSVPPLRKLKRSHGPHNEAVFLAMKHPDPHKQVPCARACTAWHVSAAGRGEKADGAWQRVGARSSPTLRGGSGPRGDEGAAFLPTFPRQDGMDPASRAWDGPL